ncbi:MAG: S41 family peptidase [Cyclobacteriaceae bacterium]
MGCIKLLWLISLILYSDFIYCQTTPSKSADLRLERLNTLADIWGDMAVHHPKLVGQEKLWDSVLTSAIPRVEKAKTTQDLILVLNASLFSCLNDPFSYASISDQDVDTTSVHIKSQMFSVSKLEKEVGYISVPTPADYGTDFNKILYESIQSLGTIDRLIIDLRTVSKSEYPPNLLSFWIDKEMDINPTVTPVYWYYHTQGQYWLTKGNHPLKPWSFYRDFLKKMYPESKTGEWRTVSVPTVFIVNHNSYPPIAGALDALQRQDNVAVVFDKTGPRKGAKVLYTEKICVNINSDMLIAHDGALGLNPDTIMQNVPLAGLLKLSDFLLKHKMDSKNRRTPFTFKVNEDYKPPSLPSLTREQKIMGLMKIWVNIKKFYAYPENMTIDWEHMLYDWIPKVERTSSSMQYYTALHEITSKVNDNHIWFWHPTLPLLPDAPSLSRTIPVLLLKVQDKVIVAQIDSSAGSKFPLAIGDEILAIDGQSTTETEAFWRKRISAAQESGFIRNVWEYAFAIRGTKDSIVTLLVQNKNGKKQVRVEKTAEVQRVTTNHPFGRKLVEILPGNIGYIRLYHIPNLAILDSAFRRLKDTRGLIFDLRGGNAPYNYQFPADMRTVLIDRLVKDPFERKGTRYIYQLSDDGLPVSATGGMSSYFFPDKSSNKVFYDNPIVVITSSRQQSYGEGIFQILQAAKRVSFVGSATVGTNGGMATIKLPDGGGLTFTQVYLSQQDGKPFHGVGILPDVKIEATIQG